MARILEVIWDGVRGMVQPPKKVVESYTRFGDKRVWMQGIKTESAVSNLVAWVYVDSPEDARSIMDSCLNNLGNRREIKLDDDIRYESCYVTDISFRYIAGKPKNVLEATISCIVDERTTDDWAASTLQNL